jgi:hypothetical protein
MVVKCPNQNVIKAGVNGFLRDALRDVGTALVCLPREDVGPAPKAQRQGAEGH